MKRWLMAAAAAALLAGLTGHVALAESGAGDETNLTRAAEGIDGAGDATRVRERLASEFHVTDAQIKSLRDKKLGYGEIAIVLSLAQKDGAVADADVARVMALRTGPPVKGWGAVAKELGVKLGDVVSRVQKAEKAAEKTAEKGGDGRHDHAEGGTSVGNGKTDDSSKAVSAAKEEPRRGGPALDRPSGARSDRGHEGGNGHGRGRK